MDEESIKLYKELLSLCGDITKYTEKAKTFNSQLGFNQLNEICYKIIYLSDKEVIPRTDFFEPIPLLKTECAKCWKFYLSPRNKSVRILDIQLGKKFQNKLIEFFNRKGIDCRKGDELNKVYPDNVVFEFY